MEFQAIYLKMCVNFQFQKILSPGKLGKKAGILRCKCMETIIHIRKNIMIQPIFSYYKQYKIRHKVEEA